LARAGDRFEASREALWWPPGKIVGRHLAPFPRFASRGDSDAAHGTRRYRGRGRAAHALTRPGPPRLEDVASVAVAGARRREIRDISR
jgi:hypothetical protein